MADTKISALTALDQSTADPAKTYVPLFHEDGSPLNRRMNFTNLRVGSFLHAGASGSAARFSSAGNGVAVLTNDAGNDLSRVCFGGTTSSFPALKRSGADVHLRLADDSAFANLQLGNLNAATMGNTSVSVAWSGTGVATTPLLVNITADPGPANAASKLLDVQLGGSSRMFLNKDGYLKLSNSGAEATYFIGTYGVYLRSNLSPVFAMGTIDDLQLTRDAADTLAQRRGMNGNTIKVYRTFTSSSTFERGTFGWHDSSSDTGAVGNILRIGTEKGSVGGTARDVELITNGTTRVTVNATSGASVFSSVNNNTTIGGSYGVNTDAGSAFRADAAGFAVVAAYDGIVLGSARKVSWASNADWFGGSIDLSVVRASANILGITNGSTGGGAIEFTEMTAPATPAANQARIFARDNGSGKTQVCVILPDGVVTVLATQT